MDGGAVAHQTRERRTTDGVCVVEVGEEAWETANRVGHTHTETHAHTHTEMCAGGRGRKTPRRGPFDTNRIGRKRVDGRGAEVKRLQTMRREEGRREDSGGRVGCESRALVEVKNGMGCARRRRRREGQDVGG